MKKKKKQKNYNFLNRYLKVLWRSKVTIKTFKKCIYFQMFNIMDMKV